MRSESEIQQVIMMEGPRFGNLLFRNNSGAFKDADGRLVRFGLGAVSKKHSDSLKSSDLIGITTFKITPEMVGMTMGQFTAIEIKKEGWKRNPKDKRENAQEAFIDLVRSKGGCAGFVSNEEWYRAMMITRYGI